MNSGVLTVTDALRTQMADMEALSGSLRVSGVFPDLIVSRPHLGSIITGQSGGLELFRRETHDVARGEPKEDKSEDSSDKK